MIVRLAKCIGEYRRDAILAPVYVSLEVVMAVVIPLLMAQILDHGIAGDNMEYIVKMGIALVASTLLSLFFGVQSGNYAAKASSGFAKNVRRDMYHNVQNFSFSNIDRFSTASLVTRLTTDVANLQNAFQMLIRIFVRSPIMLAFSLFAAIGINKKLSLVFLATIPFLGIGLYLIMSRAHPIFKQVFKVYDMLNSVVQENLRGIRVVKSYVREDFETAKFKTVSERIYREFSRAEKILAFNSPLMQFAVYTCMLLLSWFGAGMIVSDTMTTGQLMSLIAYTSQILMSLMMFSMVFVMVSISRASAERVVEVLNEKSDLRGDDRPLFGVPDGSVRFENVNFSYVGNPDKLCLKKIDLDISSGETVGIIGETGSGKSTLVQLIPRLYDTTSGKVCVGGTDVLKYDLKSLRDAVAMVLQKNILFSGTIKENLRWGNGNATDEELVQVCGLAQADEFIREFPDGYDTHVEQGGANLSGGQKQRICIARALLKKPKILILDDSTSAVDTETDLRIRRALKEELPQTTKFIIAQRISSIEDADRIVVMNRGTIEASGTHAELMDSSEIYRDVYLSQTKSGGDNDAA